MSNIREDGSYNTFNKESVDRIVKLFEDGLSPIEVAKETKISNFSVLDILKAKGIYHKRKTKRPNKYPIEIGLEMRKDLDSGMFIKDICKKYRLSKCAVQKYMIRAGVYHDTPYKTKIRKHRAATEEAVTLYKSGLPMAEIAEKLGMHHEAVGQAINRGGVVRDRNHCFIQGELIDVVIKKHLDGESNVDIGRELGFEHHVIARFISSLDKNSLYFIEQNILDNMLADINNHIPVPDISQKYNTPRQKIEILAKDKTRKLKICRKCDTIKNLTDFWGHKSARDKVFHACRLCAAAKIRHDLNTNIDKRVKNQLRGRLNNVVQRGQKCASTMTLLGCTLEDFLKHIESQFTKNMSWDNYGVGGWFLDHIKAVDRYEDLSDPAQQRECFHWTNLQPLWSTTSIAISWGESPEYIGNNEKHNFAIRGGIHGKTPL